MYSELAIAKELATVICTWAETQSWQRDRKALYWKKR